MKTIAYRLLLLSLVLLASGNDLNSASASRSFLSRAIAPVSSFVSSHPRLTKTAGGGAAVVGAYALYKWWKAAKIDKKNLEASVGVNRAHYNQEVAKVLLDVVPEMPCEVIKEVNSYTYAGFEGACSSYISDANASFLVVLSDLKFASACANTIKIWNVKTKNCLKTLDGHTGKICGLVVCGNTLISGSKDKTIKIWDIASGDCLQSFKKVNEITALALLKNRQLAVGFENGTIEIMSLKTGEKCLSWQSGFSLIFNGYRPVKKIVELSGNRILVAYDNDCGFEIRDCQHEGQLVQILSAGLYDDGPIFSLPDDVIIWARGGLIGEDEITLFDLKTQATRRLPGHSFPIKQLALLPDGTLLSAAMSDKDSLKAWNLETGACVKNVNARQLYDREPTFKKFWKFEINLRGAMWLGYGHALAVMPNGTVILGSEDRISFWT